jgi:hypothetical protein
MSSHILARIPWDRINWKTSIFLALINTMAITAVPMYLLHYGLDWFQAGLFFLLLCRHWVEHHTRISPIVLAPLLQGEDPS